MSPLTRPILILAALLPVGGVALAQEGAAVDRSQQRLKLWDGVHLTGELFRPAGETGALPTVMLVTPYGTAQHAEQGFRLAQAGYSAFYLNVRGKYGSEGQFLPFIDEASDLLESLEWVLEQPWCNGSVGLFGYSSQGYSAQILASTGHPSIRTLVNLSGLTDVKELFFPGGAFRLDTLYPWLMGNLLERRPSAAEWDARFHKLPLASGFEWEEGMLEGILEGDVDMGGIDVPTLNVTGWNDVVYRQNLLLHRTLRERDKGFQKLVVGPWLHNQLGSADTVAGDEDYGPGSALDGPALDALLVRWFDRFVKGEQNGIDEEPAVDLFVMGADEWIQADAWPPAQAEQRQFFLAPAADGEDPRRSGRLSLEAPSEGSTNSFVYDPANPVPTFGGVNSHLFPENAGPMDQARFVERDDVLVFETEPAELELWLVGPIRVDLWAATSVVDTDFTAKLVIVRPDGYSRIVEDGIRRAGDRTRRRRMAPLKPGTVTRFEIDLGATALRVAPGERLALHVSSSNFPKYDRNPNTGADSLEATELRKATQSVHLGGAHPSSLTVTVLAR